MSRGPLRSVPEEFRKHPTAAIRSARDLMARDMPAVRWVVPKILPEGVTLLAGKSKIRKSWMAMGLCVAVAAGGVAYGKVRVERGDACYFALEDNERRLKNRLTRVLAGEEAPEGFDYATECPRIDEGGFEIIQGWLEGHPGARLVVVDTLAKMRPRTRGASNNGYQEDYEALEPLLALAAEHQVAIVVVHHLRKAGATDPLDEINATTGLMGGVDGFLVLRAERGKGRATMYVTGREIEEERELALEWDQVLHGWVLTGDAEETRLTEDRRLVLDVLRSFGGPMGFMEIVRMVGKSKQAVQNLLASLIMDDRVDRVGRGKYQIAGEGESTPPQGDGVLQDVLETPHSDAENPEKYTSTPQVHGPGPDAAGANPGVLGVLGVLPGETPQQERENAPDKSTPQSTPGEDIGVQEDDPFGDDSRIW